MWDILASFWFWLVLLADLVCAGAATMHAVLYKRETRAVIGWVGLLWLAPLMGSIAYFCFGINRIERRAFALRVQQGERRSLRAGLLAQDVTSREEFGSRFPHFKSLASLVGRVTSQPLLPGNSVQPLRNGDEAYPEMLAAIDKAERSISLASYIFDCDEVGEMFQEALVAAQNRGVQIRVLIDAVGARYSPENMADRLRKAGLRVATFLPTRTARLFRYANLRNHRKLLIIDGQVGFTGGTNIRVGHWLAKDPEVPVQCLHFRLEGPVVAQLQEVFVMDWEFAENELLTTDTWLTQPEHAGDTWARGISDGPDEDFETIPHTIHGALAAARKSVDIVTPYFLPDVSLIQALNVTALRGVTVRILLPEQNNIRMVQWASMPLISQVLERGCKVFLSPPPFDHTKLMLVDGAWSLIGSTNWDPRSLRLNFEFNVECYQQSLAHELGEIFEEKIEKAKPLTRDEIENRSLRYRLRDGLARLASPYL